MRPTSRSGTKVGYSDPVVLHGRAIAAVVRSKGWAVRPLKRHASWVQNVVRQFGPYPVYAQEICTESSLVREDREEGTSSVRVIAPAVNAR